MNTPVKFFNCPVGTFKLFKITLRKQKIIDVLSQYFDEKSELYLIPGEIKYIHHLYGSIENIVLSNW